jgi:protein-S-isoprenylcysteine O-methyltransferase Ste14
VTGPAHARTPGATAVAWAGAAIFAASLAYFLFSYVVTFRESGVRSAWPRDAAIDVALFSLFALHHSVFARTPLRAWTSRVLSPQLERSVYVWIASLMLIAVCALWRPLPGIAWQVPGAGTWLLGASMAAGIWLTLRSAAIIDIWDLAGLRQSGALGPRAPSKARDSAADGAGPATPEPDAGPAEFRTDGPYGWVRHPIYSGWFLIVFSVTPMTTTRLLFAVVSCAYVLVAIPFEERSLRAASGGAYEAYMQQVRWKLIPGIY